MFVDVAKLVVSTPYPEFEQSIARFDEMGLLYTDDSKWFKAWTEFDRQLPSGANDIRQIIRAAHFQGFSKGLLFGMEALSNGQV